MGHSKAEKDESHARIVRTAAARFREVGLEGMSVADLMQEAGLTHGGFYRHFASRDELVAEAVEVALAEGSKGAFDAHASGRLEPRTLLHALIDWYLGTAHRDQLATSCAVSSLAADVSRSNPRARRAYTRQVEAYLELFTVLIGGADPVAARARAISIWAVLVGAVSMARAVNDEALSRDILATAAANLKAGLG